jgi:hypothetical protein
LDKSGTETSEAELVVVGSNPSSVRIAGQVDFTPCQRVYNEVTFRFLCQRRSEE